MKNNVEYDAPLQHLIAEALALGGTNICAAGHDWQSQGGRRCPRATDDSEPPCSQTVYQCARCGDWDYGQEGGPAHRECFDLGPCHWRCEAA